MNNILLVENNLADQVVFSRSIEKLDIECKVLVAHNGQEAIDQISEAEHEVDLVLMDINMPIMDGFTALQQIRKQELSKTIPIIMYSTSDRKQDVVKSYALGAHAFITKPENQADFKKTFQALSDFWFGCAKTVTH